MNFLQSCKLHTVYSHRHSGFHSLGWKLGREEHQGKDCRHPAPYLLRPAPLPAPPCPPDLCSPALTEERAAVEPRGHHRREIWGASPGNRAITKLWSVHVFFMYFYIFPKRRLWQSQYIVSITVPLHGASSTARNKSLEQPSFIAKLLRLGA